MRPLYIETDLTKIIGSNRKADDLRRRGPHEWVFVGTYPTTPETTAPFFVGGVLMYGSPVFENGWTNAGAPYANWAFRWSTHWEIEWQGHITGGASGTVATTLPQSHWPDHNLSWLVDVGDVGAFVVGRAELNYLTGEVTITFPAS